MSIEIKQLLVKSNVVQKCDDENTDKATEQAAMTKSLLEQCRALILEIASNAPAAGGIEPVQLARPGSVDCLAGERSRAQGLPP